MSATNRGSTRAGWDTYYSPKFTVDRLLDKIFLPGGNWLEPAAGRGDIIDFVNNHGSMNPIPTWDACEINFWSYPRVLPKVNTLYIGNYLEQKLEKRKYSVIITNPPFNLAMEFIQHSMDLEPDYIVFLLRTNFLESSKRNDFLKNNTPDQYTLPNRPSFTGEGTDATSYSWLVWPRVSRTSGNLYILNNTPKEDRK